VSLHSQTISWNTCILKYTSILALL